MYCTSQDNWLDNIDTLSISCMLQLLLRMQIKGYVGRVEGPIVHLQTTCPERVEKIRLFQNCITA